MIVVRFDYGVYEAVSCVVRFERERGLDDGSAETRLVGTSGVEEGGGGERERGDCWREGLGGEEVGKKVLGIVVACNSLVSA